MRLALGLSVHSGWAALVALGKADGRICVVDRCRMELVDEGESSWAKQPYHAAEQLDPKAARTLVERGIKAAHTKARHELEAALRRVGDAGNEVAACAILVGEPMPDWSVEEILAVHFRMHKAEGVLFRVALVQAAESCGLKVLAISEKLLLEQAQKTLLAPTSTLKKRVIKLGKTVGSPWGKDQKDAALAALIALA